MRNGHVMCTNGARRAVKTKQPVQQCNRTWNPGVKENHPTLFAGGSDPGLRLLIGQLYIPITVGVIPANSRQTVVRKNLQ